MIRKRALRVGIWNSTGEGLIAFRAVPVMERLKLVKTAAEKSAVKSP
ncbi:MAG: hypothetical protein IPM69_12090 [Ignavibacteria bacterium]|nr:hypothetical protein [Ignavibacteria bacterium]